MTLEQSERRGRLNLLLGLVALGFAVHLLLPQVGEVPQAVRHARSGSPWWLLGAAVAAVLTRIGATISMVGSVEDPLPFWTTFEVQVGASFTSLFAPQGVGLAATNAQYLQKLGYDRTVAVTASGLNSVAGFLAHFLSVFLAAAVVGPSILEHLATPPRWWLLAGAAVLAIVLGFAVWTPAGRRLIWGPALRAGASLLATLKRPVRTVQLIGGSLLITWANAVTLALALKAFDTTIPLLPVVAVYLAAAVVAAIAPTPGALGAIEAALIAGLTAIGIDAPVAVGGVLVYRLLTFWLPILPGMWSVHDLRRKGLL